MAVSARSDALLELGRRLTKELELDTSVDTLGRWMAHYIAELIKDAESASGEERRAKLQASSDAILNLWRHRHELPDGKRPFEELEPILRALESLDPDGPPRYFRAARDAGGKTNEADDANSWLEFANDLDFSAKLLIGYCLRQAAQAAVKRSEEWVALAEAAGAESEIELPLIRFVADENDRPMKRDANEAVRRQLRDRIDRLHSFTKLAKALILELKQRVRELSKHK